MEVQLDHETVWLTQVQMAALFDRDRSVISKHLRAVFQTGELDEESNVQKMHIAFSDKPVAYYNLDVIISIGYRVNSIKGTQFRRWATNILRQYLVQGFVLNEKRLRESASYVANFNRIVYYMEARIFGPFGYQIHSYLSSKMFPRRYNR